MSKDRSSKNRVRSSYEKISKVTFDSFRRISRGPKKPDIQKCSPSATGPASGEAVPIPISNATPSESFHPPGPKPFKKFVRFLTTDIKKTGDGGSGGGGKEVVGQKTFSEERYTSYIDNTKMKMRAPSAVSDGGRTISRRETFNDIFSGYISRTKMRLRTTSSVGNDS